MTLSEVVQKALDDELVRRVLDANAETDFGGGVLEIWSGSPPANPNDPPTGTLLLLKKLTPEEADAFRAPEGNA